jgi:hypothetical protein
MSNQADSKVTEDPKTRVSEETAEDVRKMNLTRAAAAARDRFLGELPRFPLDFPVEPLPPDVEAVRERVESVWQELGDDMWKKP